MDELINVLIISCHKLIMKYKLTVKDRSKLRVFTFESSRLVITRSASKNPKDLLQVFFSLSFHKIEDLRCSNCVSHGTKHASLQIEL